MYHLLIFALLLSVTSCAQTPKDKIDGDIKTERTAKHQAIAGTKVYMIFPPGFENAKSFTGLQKGESAVINILDIVGGNFSTNAGRMSKESFENQGVKVLEYKELKLNDFPAKYAILQGADQVKHLSLVFGDSSFCTMAMSSCQPNDPNTESDIKKAFSTIYYDKKKKIDPFETALFTTEVGTSDFKFFNYAANLYVYTLNGMDNSGNRDAPLIILNQMPVPEGGDASSIGQMMLQSASKYGLTELKVENSETTFINGIPAYEAVITGNMLGKPSLLYQCVLTKGRTAVSMQGIAKSDTAAMLTQFKAFARGIKMK